jgi:hypothetical protein
MQVVHQFYFDSDFENYWIMNQPLYTLAIEEVKELAFTPILFQRVNLIVMKLFSKAKTILHRINAKINQEIITTDGRVVQRLGWATNFLS